MTTPAVGDALTRPTDVVRPMADSIVVETEGGIDFRPEFASFADRFLGLVLDLVVINLATLPGLLLIVAGGVAVGILWYVAVFVGMTVWYARAVAANGQWIGNRFMKTKVVDARNGRTVPAGSAALRFVVRMVFSPILLVGFLMALGNHERRTLHDQLGGTVVTRPPRAVWSIENDEYMAPPAP